ncbi:Catechol 2,3-dioxygenase [Novosphingobium sp. CF614]|uniref:VOC family protein n=1 Tax=Novosphingobium sp. CF614 TaxID=1884364 RepID=UPI0008E2A4F7|nr:VOC family protein [Novosphingobium sp. CF614]SFF86204.1 Catechol 2,3-dioxygenase [Novosphingobium sp. CF614]
MPQRLALTALVVADYDEALAFYVDKLGFELREDKQLTPEKRWVVVAPQGSDGALLLARAANNRQSGTVGNQTGGRVFLFLETDNFARDHAAYTERGVRFVREPASEPYGTVAVFEDPYGNLWDLIEPKAGQPAGSEATI